jgi:LmbE family N-acetylglucosaminyl deacetylase
MMKHYDHLYLSPHFDDVALSGGGQVFQQTSAGKSVLVVTVTGGEAPADLQSEIVQSLHNRWQDSLAGEVIGESIVSQRRAEDRAAFAILGAEVLHLPFQDCIYRVGPDGAPLYPGSTDMFGDINPADRGIIDELARSFAALPPAGRVYVPLGVGRHIDHRVTRLAAEQTFSELIYYEDYPYTMQPGALEAALPPEDRGNWSGEVIALTDVDLTAKIDAVAAYKSQMSSFFTGYEDLTIKLLEEGRRVLAGTTDPAATGAIAGEQVWRRLSR